MKVGLIDADRLTADRADAFSYDIFSAQFGPLLPTERADSVDGIVTDKLKGSFRRYRETVLQPGGNVASYLDVLNEFLGRPASPKTYIDMLYKRAQEEDI